MLPMDIQGSNITLDIDIVAASVEKINVDLVAQTIATIGIDIKANTLGNLVIDIEAQSIGIYLKADWEVLREHDWNLTGYAECDASVLTVLLDEEVTGVNAFYICQWGFAVAAGAGLYVRLLFVHNAAETLLAIGGGYSGGMQSFTKPIAVVVGDHIKVYAEQYSAETSSCYCSVGGYWQ